MKQIVTKLLIISTDIIWLIFLFYLTLVIRQNLHEFGELPKFNGLKLYDFIFVIFIIFILMYYEKIYNFRYDFWHDTLKIVKSFVVGFLLTMSFLAITKTNLEYSRLFIFIYFTLGVLSLPILKIYTKKTIFYAKFFRQKVLVIGDEEQVEIFKCEMQKNWYLGQRYSQDNYQSVIIIAKGLTTKKLNNIIEKHLNYHREIFVVPYLDSINFVHSHVMEYSNIRLNTIQVENRLLMKNNIFIKNIFDKFVSFLILPFFLIIHMMVALAIKLDSKGSIWFKQHRLGKYNIDFKVYKYRTMYVDGHKLLQQYLKENPDEIEYYEEFHKYKNDPRITFVGKFLRATSLDELPQLINVIKGDMSLIGPRPYMLSEGEKLGDDQNLILKVKPGITGLWQVAGRNNLTFVQRNELEVWYIKNWSLWADFVILIKTISVVLGKVGAK